MHRWKLAVCGTALACLACGSLSVDQAPSTKVPSTIATSFGSATHVSPIDDPSVLPQGGRQNLVGSEQLAPMPNPQPPSEEAAPRNFQLPAEPVVQNSCNGGTNMKVMCPLAAP